MPKVQVGDIAMYYRVDGEGHPLMLISGGGNDHSNWIMQTPEFSKKHRVICFDNRGTGRTDAPDSPYSVEMMADDAIGLLDALEIDQAHILGLSLGGMIAQEIALKYPQRVNRLILLGTTARGQSIAPGFVELGAKLIDEEYSQETLFREILPWMYTEKFCQNKEQVEMIIGAVVAYPYPTPIYVWARHADAGKEHDTRDRLKEINARTLVLVGQEDIVTPLELSQELAAGIPNAELLVLEGGGHYLPFEIPNQFNQAVLEFLAKVDKDHM